MALLISPPLNAQDHRGGTEHAVACDMPNVNDLHTTC